MPPERRDPASGKPTYTAGAFAIARDEGGRVLWIRRRDTGWWGVPGGAIEFGGPPGHAAVPEAIGDAGVVVVGIRLAAIDCNRAGADAGFVFECPNPRRGAAPRQQERRVR